MSKVIFIVAEPSYIIRKGLVSLINELPNTLVARELETAQKLIETATHHGADAIVINAELLRELSQADRKTLLNGKKKTAVVTISCSALSHSDEITNISSSQIMLSESKPSVLKKIKDIINRVDTSEATPENQELSDREVEILKDVALGLSNKEIAEKNFISPHTVITHRKNITRKLGIKTVSGLTIYAILNKIIGMEALE
ncbi:response regulator transcription factor [Perlabentimonas gracilis]|uniref:response regulator transcription factor n=1 Tax=Perlabentimonas gracilis TaxID=2715279 RepID=UPI00140BDF67|nr:LuxR C-terminal-related transcriptional regulator [Perlabentimonas gracilis]NHB69464.1 response regulator transcription factor [Perlabentimonas gracilis]